jgi:hypothetical protein
VCVLGFVCLLEPWVGVDKCALFSIS